MGTYWSFSYWICQNATPPPGGDQKKYKQNHLISTLCINRVNFHIIKNLLIIPLKKSCHMFTFFLFIILNWLWNIFMHLGIKDFISLSSYLYWKPGLTGVDEAELRRVVSEPHAEHLLPVTDFSTMDTILPKLSRRVCLTASEPPRPVKTSQPSKFFVICWKSCLLTDSCLHFHIDELYCTLALERYNKNE